MIAQGNGVGNRRSSGANPTATGGSGAAPPDGSPPGRLRMTREQGLEVFRRGLRDGSKTWGDVMVALHRTGASPDRIAAGLRAVGWPERPA